MQCEKWDFSIKFSYLYIKYIFVYICILVSKKIKKTLIPYIQFYTNISNVEYITFIQISKDLYSRKNIGRDGEKI